MSVVIETTLGDITVDLFLTERPRACLNFLKLCKIKYYNFNLFHTISRGFIAQTGDPTGSRKGGESFYGVLDGLEKRYFEAENEPRIKHTKMGLISFVGNEDRMIGSQFFITLGEDLTYLDQRHCVFGEVVEGFDILEIINEVICDTDDRPYQDVRITHTVILDDPYPDPNKLKVPSRSPSPNIERLQGGRIAPDEDIDETEGKSAQEIAEFQAEREAKARATILEMVGDLPDADMAPPENVLFVCKLNPITTDDDLEIIFNRFGKIVSCEVIRDRKTGDSLQYAFIEFEDRKACEDAYFKMDNILIDDRRIHVDFSQSVSKVKWLGKGRGVTHFDEKGRMTTQSSNDVGKGNYKIQNKSNENRRTNSSKTRREKNNHRESNRNKKSRSKSPSTDSYKQNGSKRNRTNRDYRKDSRSKSRSPYRRQDFSSDRENSRKKREYRSRSRSPRRSDDRRQRLSDRERNRPRREAQSGKRDKESLKIDKSRIRERSRDRNYMRYDEIGSTSSKYHDKDYKIDRPKDSTSSKHVMESKRKIEGKHSKQSKEIEVEQKSIKKKKDYEVKEKKKKHFEVKEKKKKKRDSSTNSESDSSEREIHKLKSKKKQKKKSRDSNSDHKSTIRKKKRKKRKESTESSSSSESDDSNSSDTESSDSESSDSESSDSESSDNESSDTESSLTESSASEVEKKKKKKKRKKMKSKNKTKTNNDSSADDTRKIKKKRKK